MSGRASRQKGSRGERAIVRLLRSHGLGAEKTSRTGYTGPDVSISLIGADRWVEVKVRKDGFRELYRWLDGAEVLVVRADRQMSRWWSCR